jgi:hypothetical protein
MRTSTFAASALGMAALAVAQDGLVSITPSSRVTTTSPTTSPTTFASGTTTIKMFEAAETSVAATDFVGSIINVNAIATTVLINCRDPSNTDCVGGMTMTAGASTFHLAYATAEPVEGVEVTISYVQDCKVVSSTQAATCANTVEATASADGQKSATTSSATVTFASAEIFYDDLLITAGVDKLNSPQATQTPGAGAAIAPPVPTGSFGLSVGGMAAAAVVAAAGLL